MTQLLSRKVLDLYRAGALDPYLHHMTNIKTSDELSEALNKFVTLPGGYSQEDREKFYGGFDNIVQLSKQNEGNIFDDFFAGRISESDLCRLSWGPQAMKTFHSALPVKHGTIRLSSLIGQSRSRQHPFSSGTSMYAGTCNLSGCYAQQKDSSYFFSTALIELREAPRNFSHNLSQRVYHFESYGSLECEKRRRHILHPHTLWRVVNDTHFALCYRKIEDAIVLSDDMMRRAYSRLCVLEKLFAKSRVTPSEECRRYELDTLGKL